MATGMTSTTMALGACAVPEPVAITLTPHTGATFEPSDDLTSGLGDTSHPHPIHVGASPRDRDAFACANRNRCHPAHSLMGTPLLPFSGVPQVWR